MTDTKYKSARSIIALMTMVGLVLCGVQFLAAVSMFGYAVTSQGGALTYAASLGGILLSLVGLVLAMAVFNVLSVVFDIADRCTDQLYVMHKIKEDVRLLRQSAVPGEFE